MADPITWVRIIVFVASVAYQNNKANELKRKQEAAAEERRGFEFTIVGEAAPVPVAYGKNLLGGIAVKHRVKGNYINSSTLGDDNFNEGFDHLVTTIGSKNEYLHVQHALCQGGIEGVQSVKVNSLDWNDPDQRFNHLIRTYRDGGSADAIASANGIPSTNTFTGTAYASSTFKLDRDDPQYNGSPSMGFFVKGRKVRAVELNTGVYSLATSYVYSNNPALCLLDYLLNADFGRGLSVDDVDLESFYNSAVVCGTTVSTGRAVGGVVNGGDGTSDLPLYECNIALDCSKTIRDNIQRIMQTMALAELTWSSEGKYKLLVEYPTSTVEQDALVDADHYFTDDDIIRDEINISWPSASERLNQCTITFSNEFEDFKTDSVTWPKSFSTAHNAYLAEDNNQPFATTLDLNGTTDPYHALATAEQLVREARSAMSLTLTVSKRGLSIEPGDFINITSATSNISDEVFRVQSIEVNADFTVGLTCSAFNYETLAWNVNDDIAYSTRPTYDFSVEPVTSLVYTAGRPSGDHTALAELTWAAPTDGSFKSVVYYTDGSGDLVILGETSSNEFFIYPRPDWTDGESVTFTVKAQTPLGRLSTGVTVSNTVVKTPAAPTSFSAAETLYQTNKASGVKARATLSFSDPVGGVEPKDYKVEYYRDEDGSTYELLGYTVGQTYVFNDIRAGNYHFRITPISWFDDEGTPLVGTKLILGLSAIPADPTGFVSKVTDSGILFTWDTPSDLDVVSGGTTEIRYVRNDIVTPKWEIAQTIVNNISGSTTTATLPISAGYYLIKHIDSSGNACAEPAQLLNSFVGPDFNAITTITEDPTFAGTKTGCHVGTELVTNGTFDTDTAGWITANGGTIAAVGGQLVVTNTTGGTYGAAVYAIPTIIGNTYDVSVDLIAKNPGGWAIISESATHYAPEVGTRIADNPAAGATYTGSFVAVGTTSYLHLLAQNPINSTSTWDNISVIAGDATLELDNGATTMTYLFDNDIDLGSVENIRLVPSLTALITDGTTVVADYDPVSAVTRFGGPIVDAAINFEVRHTDDDPSGTPTWSDWETFSVGNYRARGFEFRLTGTVAAAAYTVIISELSLTADKADVYKRGTSTSSASANITVTFASNFYGGIGGTDLPHVGFSTIGGSAGDSINIVSITKSAFVYSVYNSGARVVRNISWQAVGQ